MSMQPLNVLLADDDLDDCQFFEAALKKLPQLTNLTTVHDGEALMRLLVNQQTKLPDVLFLDLNMPRKNGFECLTEIKGNVELLRLPIIVFSTSFDQARADMLYNNGAQYFMRKPAEFAQLKDLIQLALTHIAEDMAGAQTAGITQPAQANFILTVHNGLPV